MIYNTYITFASWEDRFIETLNKDINDNEFNKILILNYENGHNLDNKQLHIDKIEELNSKKISVNFINMEINNDISNWKLLNDIFKDNIEGNVLLNISTMPRNIIYYSLHFLDNLGCKYTVIYYNAIEHDSKLTQSPLTPNLILQHSGIFYSHKKTLLVVSLGYDEKRIYQVYNHFEPKKLIVLSEDKHKTSIDKDVDFQFTDIEEKNIIKINSFEQNNIFSILEQTITPLLQEYNIILCSLGPKISSLELYKYNKKYPETGLCYVSLKEYSNNYSTGVDLDDPIIVFNE